MVSIGKGDVGAAKLTGEVLDVMERLPKTVEGLTGVNMTKVSISLSTELCVFTDQFSDQVEQSVVCVCVCVAVSTHKAE